MNELILLNQNNKEEYKKRFNYAISILKLFPNTIIHEIKYRQFLIAYPPPIKMVDALKSIKDMNKRYAILNRYIVKISRDNNIPDSTIDLYMIAKKKSDFKTLIYMTIYLVKYNIKLFNYRKQVFEKL